MAISGNHPPANAQLRPAGAVPVVPVLTIEDALQDSDIAAVNKHVDSTDANVARNWVGVQKNAADIAGMQGEERGIGAFLALLSGTGLILQVRSKKAP